MRPVPWNAKCPFFVVAAGGADDYETFGKLVCIMEQEQNPQTENHRKFPLKKSSLGVHPYCDNCTGSYN